MARLPNALTGRMERSMALRNDGMRTGRDFIFVTGRMGRRMTLRKSGVRMGREKLSLTGRMAGRLRRSIGTRMVKS